MWGGGGWILLVVSCEDLWITNFGLGVSFPQKFHMLIGQLPVLGQETLQTFLEGPNVGSQRLGTGLPARRSAHSHRSDPSRFVILCRIVGVTVIIHGMNNSQVQNQSVQDPGQIVISVYLERHTYTTNNMSIINDFTSHGDSTWCSAVMPYQILRHFGDKKVFPDILTPLIFWVSVCISFGFQMPISSLQKMDNSVES